MECQGCIHRGGEEYAWSIHGLHEVYMACQMCKHQGRGVCVEYTWTTWSIHGVPRMRTSGGGDCTWSIHGLHGVYTGCQGCIHRGEGIIHGVYMDYMEYTWHAKDAYIGGEEYAMTSAPMLRQAVHWNPIRQCLPWHTQLLHQAWTLLAISCFRNGFVFVFVFQFVFVFVNGSLNTSQCWHSHGGPMQVLKVVTSLFCLTVCFCFSFVFVFVLPFVFVFVFVLLFIFVLPLSLSLFFSYLLSLSVLLSYPLSLSL